MGEGSGTKKHRGKVGKEANVGKDSCGNGKLRGKGRGERERECRTGGRR